MSPLRLACLSIMTRSWKVSHNQSRAPDSAFPPEGSTSRLHPTKMASPGWCFRFTPPHGVAPEPLPRRSQWESVPWSGSPGVASEAAEPEEEIQRRLEPVAAPEVAPMPSRIMKITSSISGRLPDATPAVWLATRQRQTMRPTETKRDARRNFAGSPPIRGQRLAARCHGI